MRLQKKQRVSQKEIYAVFLYCVVVLLHNQTSLKTEIINLSSLNFLYLQSYIKQSFFDL